MRNLLWNRRSVRPPRGGSLSPQQGEQRFELGEHLFRFDELHRNAGLGFLQLGFSGFTNDYAVQLSKGNAVAAMPSLHASFALIVPLFFIRWVRQRWVRIALLSFPALMLTSLVYLGEHWVIDGIVGWLITVATFLFWDWHERRTRGLRVDIARDALGIPGIAAATTT